MAPQHTTVSPLGARIGGRRLGSGLTLMGIDGLSFDASRHPVYARYRCRARYAGRASGSRRLAWRPRGGDEGETATGVMDPRTREKGCVGLRWINMVITLIRGRIWRDLTMFPSGSSIKMGVSLNAKKL